MAFHWLADAPATGPVGAARPFRSAQGARVCWRGRELVNFASDDYLNLAADCRPARSAARALRHYGAGAGAPPYVGGFLLPQNRLEQELAEFLGAEAALVFAGEYDASVGVIGSLLSPADALFADCMNQPSLYDGSRLSGAGLHLYDHCSPRHLSELLKRHGRSARRRLIATDSVFSLDGDLAPLHDLAGLAVRHDAMLLVNEDHALGIMGPSGRGLGEWLDHCEMRPALELIKIGSLGKAVGAQGGYVAGPRPLIDWLRRHARPYATVTALAPPLAAAAWRSLRIIAAEPERRIRVLRLAAQLRESLRAEKFTISASESHILSVLVGPTDDTIRLAERLHARGFLTTAVTPPLVPGAAARLRFTVTAGHHDEEIRRVAEVLRGCRPEVERLSAA